MTESSENFVRGLKKDIAYFDHELNKPFRQPMDVDDKRRIVHDPIKVGVLEGTPEERPPYKKPENEMVLGEVAQTICREADLDLTRPEHVAYLQHLLDLV